VFIKTSLVWAVAADEVPIPPGAGVQEQKFRLTL
jgi:hypothetical protein